MTMWIAATAEEGMRPAHPKQGLGKLRLAALILGAGVLAWLIVTRGFGSYLADIAPETALRFNPHDPVALLRVAEMELAPVHQQRSEEASSGSPSSVNPDRQKINFA